MRIASATALALVVGKLPSRPTHPRQPRLVFVFFALFRQLLRLSPYRDCLAARCVIPAQAGIHVFLLTTC